MGSDNVTKTQKHHQFIPDHIRKKLFYTIHTDCDLNSNIYNVQIAVNLVIIVELI
jgi:hypothetical protein